MNTNEYFAVNLILRHKIKLTASVSALLVLPLCGMHSVVKNGSTFVLFVVETAALCSPLPAKARRRKETNSQRIAAGTPAIIR